MGLKAMATVNLHNEHSTRREAFGKEMARRKWVRIKAFPATWCITYIDEVTDGVAMSVATNGVKEAAKESKVKRYDAAIMLGAELPTVF